MTGRQPLNTFGVLTAFRTTSGPTPAGSPMVRAISGAGADFVFFCDMIASISKWGGISQAVKIKNNLLKVDFRTIGLLLKKLTFIGIYIDLAALIIYYIFSIRVMGSPALCELSLIKMQLFVMQSLVRILPDYERICMLK